LELVRERGGGVRNAVRERGAREGESASCHRKVDVRLPGKGNSKSHDARPVHIIITMI